MKKIALTSLLAVFAVSTANAGVSNLLYRPGAHTFVSTTELSSHSESAKDFTLGEKIEYGITKYLSVGLETDVKEGEWFDTFSWNGLAVDVDFRWLDINGWKGDIYGSYALSPIWDGEGFLKEEYTGYKWVAGTRAGYVGHGWTVAGHVDFTYMNVESFNWNEKGLHLMTAGVEGQLYLPYHLNLVAGIDYKIETDYAIGHGWGAKLGLNYDFSKNSYVGAYVSYGYDGVESVGFDDHFDEWAKGVGYGVKFGVQF